MKNKVCVPIMGTINDAAALVAYNLAMPGYQVIGFLGNPSTPWESTDALHCRAHEMADTGMLMISHLPFHDSVVVQPCFQINADITAFSQQLIYPDSVWTIYKVNTSDWDTLTMTNTDANHWTACIPGQMEGSLISYYIQAEDASNRSSFHPYIGAPDPHKFYVKTSLRVSPDTLQFLTFDDLINGKTAVVQNIIDQDVVIDQINNSGENPFPWQIDPWNITLPYTLQSGNSLNLTVKLGTPLSTGYEILCDTLFVNTAFANNQLLICVDPFLLTKIESTRNTQSASIYPNPMNSSTTFSLYNDKEGKTSIEIYSSMGELVSIPYSNILMQGSHLISWEGNDTHGRKLSPGIYLYRIVQGNSIKTGKISIVQ
jgi:hypothetical protein